MSSGVGISTPNELMTMEFAPHLFFHGHCQTYTYEYNNMCGVVELLDLSCIINMQYASVLNLC